MPMELTNKGVIKELLKKYNAKPEKYLGQHFILSKSALQKMIDEVKIVKNDTIVEIGSGLGTLTKELAETGAKIIAIEKDPLMISILKETLVNYKNVKIIQADARNLFKPNLPTFYPISNVGFGKSEYSEYKVIANLPYNVATFLIRRWLEIKNPPEMMVLIIQKEVARRIVAKPPRMNLLAVSTQFYAIAEIVKYVPKEMFWPRPKVDAAIIKIVPKNLKMSKRSQKTRRAFFAVVKAGFSQPRKQLINNLSKKINIPKEKLVPMFRDLNISERVRAENLDLNQWLCLLKLIT